MSRIEFSLQRLKTVVEESENRLRRLHAPLEEAIRGVTLSLEGIPPDDEDGFPGWETVLDEGTRYLEDLLGMAFTAAQTQIKAVEATARSLSTELHKDHQRGVENVQKQLLDRGYRLDNGVAAIKFANAVADFWKHRDQWDGDAWSWIEGRPEDVGKKANSVTARTGIYLRDSGLSAGDIGQMPKLARFFGITDYADLDPLRKAVHYWGHDLVFEIEREFELA